MANHVAMHYRGELLIFGGEVAESGDSAVAVRSYTRRNGWQTLQVNGTAPRGRVAAAAAAVEGDRLYVFGGFAPDDGGGVGGGFGVGYTNAMHVLDLRSQPPRWRAVSAEGKAAPVHAPSPRRDATLTWWPGSSGGALLAFGGWFHAPVEPTRPQPEDGIMRAAATGAHTRAASLSPQRLVWGPVALAAA